MLFRSGFGLMSTKIKNATGDVLILSNSSFKELINFSRNNTSLLINLDVSYDTDIDKYFRIVLDCSGADWTFVCPPDYKGITRKDKRIERFFKDGMTIIPKVLNEMEYDVEVENQMRKTISSLWDKIHLLNQIREENEVHLVLEVVPTIYVGDTNPCLAPPLDVIDFCHATRTEIDIDMYVYDSDDE